MRHRICMAIITANNSGSIVRRENKEQLEVQSRRAQFEKSYNKKVLVVGKSIDASLTSFSNGIAQQIADFKKSKRNERLVVSTAN